MGAVASSQRGYDGKPELASKLAASQPTLLAFMSPHCGLCTSLRPALEQVASSSSTSCSSGGVQVAVLNAQLDKEWAPEMLVYKIETVPCVVLLDPGGNAVAKTPAPRSKAQMEAALREMAQHAAGMARPQR